MANLDDIKEGLDEALNTKEFVRKVLLEGIGPAYQVGRDGQLFPTVSSTPAQAFFNFAMLPGWQKWKPIYRHGVLDSINREENTGSVTLEEVTSSAQNLAVLRVADLSEVEFDYMNCDHVAFEEGDKVLVKFMPNGSVQNKLSALDSAKADLKQVQKELIDLRVSLSRLDMGSDTLLNELGSLHSEYQEVSIAYQNLLEEDPQNPEAIAEKAEELLTIQEEIDAKEAEISAHQDKIDAKYKDIAAKENELLVKKDAIKAQADSIANNMEDFAEPTIIGFKEEPKPCNEIFPYLKVSGPPFPADGYLICHADKFREKDASDMKSSIDFAEDFELIPSPYGRHPGQYETVEGEGVVEVSWLAYRWDTIQGFWDDVPYMNAAGFDPVFYDGYSDYTKTYGQDKPHKIESDKEVDIDTWEDQVLGRSGFIHHKMRYYRYLYYQRDTELKYRYVYTLAGKVIAETNYHKIHHAAGSYDWSSEPAWTYDEDSGHTKLYGGYTDWWDFKDAWILADPSDWDPPIPPPAEKRVNKYVIYRTYVYIHGECYDQDDPSKYGVIITKTQTEQYKESSPCIPICHDSITVWIMRESYNKEIGKETYFEGLGFKEDVPSGGVVSSIRLYNFKGKYVCLFSMRVYDSGYKFYLGSAVEGGEFSIKKVNEFLVGDETYKLGTHILNYGFVERNKPEEDEQL